jgi:hypothetical protein
MTHGDNIRRALTGEAIGTTVGPDVEELETVGA